MIISKLRIWAVTLIVVITVGLLLLSIGFIINYKIPNDNGEIIFCVLGALFFIWMLCQMIFNELRTKAIKVIISEGKIEKISFFGIGFKTEYAYNSLSGFKTSSVPAKGTDYEYLYIIIGSTKVIKLSEFYHTNYSELKNALINKNIYWLGKEQYSVLADSKEMFK